jgi:hypothetical protein
MSWLSGYKYRVKIPCTATSAGTQTNYTKKITIVKGSGTNSAGTVYLQNHALNWPNDIRFTKSDGVTLLDHYREEHDPTDGSWWVELDSIGESGDTNFYIYYGNDSDTDASNGPNSFIFFDDGELGNLSRWTTAGACWSAQDITKVEGSYGIKGSGGATGRELSKTISTGKSVIIHTYCRFTETSATVFYVNYPKTGLNKILVALVMQNGEFKYVTNSPTYSSLPTPTAYSANTWYLAEVAIDNKNQLFRWWIDGQSKGSSALKDYQNNAISTTDYIALVRSYANDSVNYNGHLDQYWIRAYAYPEPAWASPSAEGQLAQLRRLGDGLVGTGPLVGSGLI